MTSKQRAHRTLCPACGGSLKVVRVTHPLDGMTVRFRRCSKCGRTLKSVERLYLTTSKEGTSHPGEG